MSDDTSGVNRDDNELEITRLQSRDPHEKNSPVRHQRFTAPTRRRLAIGLSLVALVAILLGSQSGVRDPLRQMVNAALFPTPLPTATPRPTATPPIPVLATPVAPFVMATPLPDVTGVPNLDPAPASCGGASPTLTAEGPPWNSSAIGREPVLLSGFIGPQARLRLGPAAAAKAYDWPAPYTHYGWPAPIGLNLRQDLPGPVTLSGYDPRTGYPLWFGFIVAGNWGAPEKILPTYVLDPTNPIVPAGGSYGEETFWYGYVFLPGAGCYTISASWPGGGWQALVSAGQ